MQPGSHPAEGSSGGIIMSERCYFSREGLRATLPPPSATEVAWVPRAEARRIADARRQAREDDASAQFAGGCVPCAGQLTGGPGASLRPEDGFEARYPNESGRVRECVGVSDAWH